VHWYSIGYTGTSVPDEKNSLRWQYLIFEYAEFVSGPYGFQPKSTLAHANVLLIFSFRFFFLLFRRSSRMFWRQVIHHQGWTARVNKPDEKNVCCHVNRPDSCYSRFLRFHFALLPFRPKSSALRHSINNGTNLVSCASLRDISTQLSPRFRLLLIRGGHSIAPKTRSANAASASP